MEPTKPKRAPKKVSKPDNKYAPKDKVGANRNRLRTPVAVTRVGLGGLTVETK